MSRAKAKSLNNFQRSAAVIFPKSLPFGKCRRITLFSFSLLPHL